MGEKTLRDKIGDLAFEVTQNCATEKPFTGEYNNFFEKGIYVDIVGGEVLFTSLDKYESGCGWPAFSKPVSDSSVENFLDNSYGLTRIEVKSKNSKSHLGHVFDDGPIELGGLRYCINSAALKFIPYEKMEEYGYGEYKKIFENN